MYIKKFYLKSEKNMWACFRGKLYTVCVVLFTLFNVHTIKTILLYFVVWTVL